MMNLSKLETTAGDRPVKTTSAESGPAPSTLGSVSSTQDEHVLDFTSVPNDDNSGSTDKSKKLR